MQSIDSLECYLWVHKAWTLSNASDSQFPPNVSIYAVLIQLVNCKAEVQKTKYTLYAARPVFLLTTSKLMRCRGAHNAGFTGLFILSAMVFEVQGSCVFEWSLGLAIHRTSLENLA